MAWLAPALSAERRKSLCERERGDEGMECDWESGRKGREAAETEGQVRG